MKGTSRQILLLCFFFSGATSLALEVSWSKELSYVLGNTLYAVSTVVAAFMAGLGLGSALAGKFGVKFARPLKAYGLLQFGVALWGMGSIPLFRATRPLFEALYTSMAPGAGTFLLALQHPATKVLCTRWLCNWP